jgi:hypothetical protein
MGWEQYWQQKKHVTKKLYSHFPCLDSFWVFSEKPSMLSIHTLRTYARLEPNGFRGTCQGWPFFLEVENNLPKNSK